MKFRTLLRRSLLYYWRTDGAAALGVAVAVAVLAGALLVGDSVRATLRELVFERLGNTRQVLSSAGFFRESLAEELGAAVPVIALEGIVAGAGGGRRAARVQVWGVDERFWRFHGRHEHRLADREAESSPALAAELGLSPGDAVLLRLEKPSAVPLESLHGRKDDSTRTIRLRFKGTLPPGQLGEFSLRPRQGAVRALFVPLARLQQDLEQPGKANMVLLSQPADQADVKAKCRLEDLGIRLRPLDQGRGFAVESDGAILSDPLAEVVASVAGNSGAAVTPIYTYLANAVRSNGRAIPYSLISAVDAAGVAPGGIALNAWAAAELRARPGDEVSIEYYQWHPDGHLLTETATFRLERILPMTGLGADRELAPDYPGISDSKSLSDWDPPFPIDLSRIRPADDAYWDRYRTAPKAFIALGRGQQLWATRHGRLTSIRVTGASREEFARRLHAAIDPAAFGLALESPRSEGQDSAAGATDFAEYFTYFSFLLVVAALLLAGLFFRFGVEQRLTEIGALRAMGFAQRTVRNLLLAEGVAIALAGAAAGVLGSLAYAWFILYGLRTWWVDAVGTTLLSMHLSTSPLLYGALGGAASAVFFLLAGLRQVRKTTPRALLAGQITPFERIDRTRRSLRWAGWAAAAAASALIAGGAFELIGQTAAFFGAGSLLLASSLSFTWTWLRRRPERALQSVTGLGFRYTAYRPGRSILLIALIASAAFIVVAVDSFRRGGAAPTGRQSGTGGFPLMAESALPFYHDLNSPDGRDRLNLPEDAAVPQVFSFRLRPGDDASCLNLYRPRKPRIVAPPRELIEQARFRFAASLAQTAPQKANPWLLLDAPPRDGAIPAIADANSLRYVLHLWLGDVLELPGGVRLRFVAALADSIFQSEVIISPDQFVRAFPQEGGFRLFLIDAGEKASEAAGLLEDSLRDYGLDVVSTQDRLAAFHRVENTYLSTFQLLGGLGLLLGTAGLGAVLLRNVLERRRELALLRAVGYGPGALRRLLLSESVLLLVTGLATGTACALIAIAPAWWDRGGRLPFASMGVLLASVLLAGLLASLLALRLATRAPILTALRSE
ncbi:MAG: ABC transporter permease [Acidobacteriota bacterium]